MLRMNEQFTLITGPRKTLVQVVGVRYGKLGRVLKLRRLKDEGVALTSGYEFPYASLRWTYTKQGNFTFILEQFAEGRRVA